MNDTNGRALGPTRVADSLLRSLGGQSVLLRLPGVATAGDDTEQLGLSVPVFQDVTIGPVVYRKLRPTVETDGTIRAEMLVSSTAIEKQVGSLQFDSASVFFAQAVGVIVDGVLMRIESVTVSELFGKPYLYRLELATPLALTT